MHEFTSLSESWRLAKDYALGRPLPIEQAGGGRNEGREDMSSLIAVVAGAWIAAHCVTTDGALTVRPGGEAVSGYFGNITARGLVASGDHFGVVARWMEWYVAHAHGSGSGVDGVPDDGRYDQGQFISRGRPDSTDAYGATFISLANAAYQTGDPALRALVLSHRPDMERIAGSMLATMQPNGLTFSRPQHPFAYAIDNEQVYRGLMDAAALWGSAYHDTALADRFLKSATILRAGIERVLWDDSTQSYRPFVDALGRGAPADLTRAYPDALAQVMAITYGVVAPTSLRAAVLLSRASAALLEPAKGDAAEYREVVRIARTMVGGPAGPLDTIDPPPLCSDAGWQLRADAAARQGGPSRGPGNP